jgi:hypothetical protein
VVKTKDVEVKVVKNEVVKTHQRSTKQRIFGIPENGLHRKSNTGLSMS